MRTIAFVTPKIDTFSNPTLIFLFEKLLEKDYTILFFGFEQMFIPSEIRKRIKFYQLPFNFYEFNYNYKDIKKLLKQYYFIYKTLKVENKPDKIICVDPMGLVIAGRINKIVKLNIIYASFEIFFEDEFYVQRKKIIKKLEMKYSGNVALVVIQDSTRERLLRIVNNFGKSTKFLHIPVSPKPIDYTPGGYDIYSELNIPRDKKIIIYSGTLMAWSGVNELIDLLPDKLRSDLWIVIHSHHKLSDNDELKIKMKEMSDKNYNLSFHNKAFYDNKDYFNFLSACHIGIATYFPNNVDIFAGKNIQEIGLSSGKFSTYMMIGLPTITTPNTIYKELNNKYNFGQTIEKPDDIPSACEKILSDYEIKSENCKELYAKELNPVSKINQLMNYIEDPTSLN
ncbi:MAG: hypothetical protein IPG09_08405 [Ignavibacteria bacterium]|nr:hypothetical protein [Ignavibacteria bacterium]